MEYIALFYKDVATSPYTKFNATIGVHRLIAAGKL